MPDPISLIGFHPTFDAEMTTSADMAKFRTRFENGDRTLFNNREGQAYADDNVPGQADPFGFANGALTITATPTPYNGQPYTSGLIETLGNFTQNQGYFEIRAQTTGTSGFWPAFWMLPPGAGNPEFDILEQPNNAGPSSYWTFLATNTDHSGGFTDVGVDLSAGYHTYGLMWTADTVQFTFDGRPLGDPHPTPPVLTGMPMYMIANLAVGGPGGWPGVPDAGASAAYNIDYIRAYSSDPGVAAIAMQPISSPDGANTTPQLTSGAPVSPALQTIGAGADGFLFRMSEDAWQGNAQFTVSVDGVQTGGVLTTTASHGAGQSQEFDIRGNFGAGGHTAVVSFVNDAWGGSSATDRNLFVDAASFNGQAVNPGSAALFSNGSASFVRPGGADTLTLAMAEDAWQGDAQAEISIDGRVLGSTTVTAANAGTPQQVSFTGDFGAGAHTVGVNFLNDAYGGDGADRNLFVKGMTFNGTAHPEATANMWSGGLVNFNI